MARSRIIPEGGTAGQVLSKVDGDDHNVEWAAGGGGGGGLLFELDTTVTTDIAGTTEAQGESGAGAGPAGTLTPTGNVAADWMASTKLLEFAADASLEGILVRRIITGTLPAAGYILDVGIGYVSTDPSAHGVIMIGYQQNTGTAFTGFGIYFRDGAANCYLMAVGDDGGGAPHVPTYVASGGFNASLNDWTSGPVRLVIELRKLDGQVSPDPPQWAIRVDVYSLSGAVNSYAWAQVAYPESAFATPLDFDVWTPDRIGVGCWNTAAAQAATIRLSHLRVYELDPGSVGGGPGIDELTADVTAGPGSGAQAATVVALRGRSIHTAAPSDGDVLTWNNASTRWEPSAASGGLGNYAVRKRSMALSRGGR